jgi:hypothetical protein
MHKLIGAGILVGIAVLLIAALPAEKSYAPSSGTAARGSNTLDDVILSESFDYIPNGQLPAGWTQVSLDSGRDSAIFRGGPSIWQAIQRVGISTHTGPGTSIDAYNDNASPNDDWMILPRMDSLLAPITLSYWVSSQDILHLESFETRVSTTDAQPASFTTVLRSVGQTPHLWTQYTDNLSAYAGAHFYIAIHYNSMNQYAIKVDDVRLTATRANGVGGRADIPTAFAFEGNYPNPFNSRTEFRFSIPTAGHADLALYNIVGQQVAQVLNGTLTAGEHTVAFDGSSLATGIYLARLTADRSTATRKMMLLR